VSIRSFVSRTRSRRTFFLVAPTASAFAALAVVGFAPAARAQMGGMGPGMSPGGGMPSGPSSQPPKEEGPAQEAPEDNTTPADLEPLAGYGGESRRRVQLFEIDGYLRVRTDYMHNFNLGQGYSDRSDPLVTTPGFHGLPPFPTSLLCPTPSVANATTGTDLAYAGCGHKDLGQATLRFRVEPTINVTDQVRIHSQFDVLDNTILGSTPDSLAMNRTSGGIVPQAPIPFLYTTQDPPEIGQNGYTSSIRAKRAWAEIDTEFGSLRFGRMPWHFGRGISFNDGSCLDCDGGTTVDRIALLTELYGHQFTLALDYGTQGLTSNQLATGRIGSNGMPIDLGQDDDVYEYMAAVTHIDTPAKLREKLDRGEVVLNYGLQLVYRSQHTSYDTAGCTAKAADATTATLPPCLPGTGMIDNREQALPANQEVNAFLFQPNVWMKLQYRSLTVEFEGTAILGRMDHGGILLTEPNAPVYFRQWGGVLSSELRLYRDTFFVGFETGAASGDQAENDASYLNYRWRFVQQPSGDHSIRDFKFSPEYHVDSILFRHILGTVSNAVYFKPAVSYWFDLTQNRQLGLAGSVIYSLAQVPVATPGNGLGYGLEMNVGANYRNTAEGFYAGFTWGVLWPMGALNRPDTLWTAGQGAGNATAAQVLRGFLGVKF